ncbi:nicotinate phosphoribosyltransferase [Solitalea canadensis]|uniref:Nicotinate phosphoribosyltransferase n=1 Tax=Solitalea canadensis (strain ATCC 29591 / DSM 3403 / JCM 21819 / LMG 8368 / NBRC 15130 / NCIMB 12057 / USAM 9D) TaxID=929556 RepID=H8KNF7_SOLCM|nr:nicotinate phosphoribosyltransferase [Solitalea canadensis]AFD07955.1 nicotinate phosphoribosyltransferase [Solitalea canadensis DSM 3403]
MDIISPSFQLLSLLDNDFYKFTMQHAVVKQFPNAKARYQFINRGKHEFPIGFDSALRQAVDAMAGLQLSKEEKNFLTQTCPYLDPAYLDFLQGYRYDPSEVIIQQNNTAISISIEGYWYRTILWEVPLLSLVSELYYRLTNQQRVNDEQVIAITKDKIEKYNKLGVTVADFGTRRRHSYQVQRLVIDTLRRSEGKSFIGTSNVHMAMLYQTKPIGTHAHEWFMFHAARYGFKMANSLGLEHWVDVYRGDLGIALSDTYTSNVFFEQFDKKFAKLFDGVRHDSGDPVEFAEKTIRHYEKLGINPLYKTIIFSDALNYDKVEVIANYCKGKIGVSFGIGTNLTNDVGLKPMNMVIKLTETLPQNKEWTPVVKLSDEKGKYTGEPKMIELAKTILSIPY